MSKVDIWEPEDPRKVYESLIERCKQAKEWCVAAIVNESWVPHRKFPFQYFMADGIYYFRVISTTYREAVFKVVDNVPVIKFVDLDDEQE
jgi:hypothetical protein